MSPSDARPTVVRYTAGERTTHWLIALTFVLAALSGLVLFHPALFWLSVFFGGGPWTRILHPFTGLFMLIVFLSFAATVWDHNRMQPAASQWLRRARAVVTNRGEQLPEVRRRDAGQ